MCKIVLAGINARYTHTSIALRYLFANLEDLQEDAEILEFVINENSQDIVEKILSKKPDIIGISVYIWNAIDVHNLIEILKKASPSTKIILGGPEVTYLPFRVNFDLADYIIQGEGEKAFYELCRGILGNDVPQERIIRAKSVNLKEIKLPYKYYTDHDVQNRYMYVEASRGCPFKCEFCLSSIDKKVRYFKKEDLLREFDILWQRGARNFKFIDRTFNLDIDFANSVMDFFLGKTPPYLVHFEVIPEIFPQSLRERLAKFPPASLQLEIGIQTLNERIAANINRKFNFNKIKKNIDFLENNTDAHLHLDLIVGLPGEGIEEFGKNLNRLCSITTSEIQVGILKKLSGTSLSRHDERYGMVYSDKPPYDILKNNLITFEQMQKMKRFARFWDLTYNSGNFSKTVRYIWEDGKVFEGFYRFSEWIYSQTESTWQISLNRLSELLFRYITEDLQKDKTKMANLIVEDIIKVRGRKIPGFLREYATHIPDLREKKLSKLGKRQALHAEK